jgi:hypothetical protein
MTKVVRTISAEQFDDFRERYRLALLAGSDRIMGELCLELGVAASDNLAGARDADLPELFKGLDAQFSRNLAYVGVAVEGEAPPAVTLTRALANATSWPTAREAYDAAGFHRREDSEGEARSWEAIQRNGAWIVIVGNREGDFLGYLFQEPDDAGDADKAFQAHVSKTWPGA